MTTPFLGPYLLSQLPRLPLGVFPTPLHPAPRLSAALGGPDIWFKRDDLTGLGLGGNKVRKLEFLLADALAQGCDVIVTTGAAQSNHARQTAAACARLGLRCVLVLQGDPRQAPQGNVLLDELFGAEVHLRPDITPEERNQAVHRMAEQLRAEGHRPYEIPVGGSNGLGALSYAAAVPELNEQLRAVGITPVAIVVSSSSGGTHAGLIIGGLLTGSTWQVWGMSADHDSPTLAHLVRTIGQEASNLAAVPPIPSSAIVCFDQYVGPGYGEMTEACREAILITARYEGILLDPVYTGKAMAGLIDQIRRGNLRRGQTVIFLHTGGAPALFAYAPELIRAQ